MEEVTSIGLGAWMVVGRERVGPLALRSLCVQVGRRPGLLEKGHAWPGTAELEEPGGLQAQPSGRQLGQGEVWEVPGRTRHLRGGLRSELGSKLGPTETRRAQSGAPPWGPRRPEPVIHAQGSQGPAGVRD